MSRFRFLDMARSGDAAGVVLGVIAVVCLFINKGDTPRQRKAHRAFRVLLALSCINFVVACTPGASLSLQRVAPLANNLLIRWLIASIFFMPAWPVAEAALMRETRSSEKTKALVTDFALALVYSIAVAGALAIAIAGAA